ncbi:MAG TPA: hypothetical protein DDW76_06660 [Cyanobacteria bacterium UBA11369]|nr:hypothetical protein [Cyanobacteria bacterium UBA11371]HBE33392.1 hypothetical protein [Cyanobacteria bacterium UBA11368]HBE48482.1 hypothetical protein [Cyanobacteria bacterium UBA11369]
MEKHFTLEEKVISLINKSLCKIKPTQRDTALQLLSNALEQAERISTFSSKTYYFNEIASAYAKLGDKEKCLEVLERAIKVAQAISDDGIKATELSKLGSNYANIGLAERGLELLDQAFQIATLVEDVDERDFSLCDVAYAYGEMGLNDLAIEIAKLIYDKFRAGLRIFDPLILDSINLAQHEQVLKFIEASEDIGETWIITLAIERYTKLADYDHPLQFFERLKLPESKILVLANLAKAHLQAGNSETALKLRSQAIAIAETIKDKNSLAFARELIKSIDSSMRKSKQHRQIYSSS